MPIAKLRLAAALSLALAAAVAPAHAAIMRATFTGTIDGGGDFVGVFGPPLTALNDMSFEQVFIYDTNRGIEDAAEPTADARLGGIRYGAANPILDSWVTVAGHTVHINADFQGAVERHDDRLVILVSDEIADGLVRASYQDVTFSPDAPLAVDTPFSRTIAGCDFGCGLFVRGMYQGDGFTDFDYVGGLKTTSVTVEQMGGAPEPGAWNLAILGFGLAGAGLRRRRRSAQAA